MKNKSAIKKIGILTLPLNLNYGGIIQAYALLTYISSLGHNVEFINLKIKPSFSFPYKLRNFLYKVYFNKFYIDRIKTTVELPIQKFKDENINPKTSVISSIEKLNNINQYNYSAFIVGSDQVWRFEYSKNFKKTFFLDFIENKKIKKIAYAASFGINEWVNHNYTVEIKNLLNKFNKISVREDSAVKICKDIFSVYSELNLDPALLLKKEDYINIINKTQPSLKFGNIYTYILDDTQCKNEIIHLAEQNLGLKSFSVNFGNKYKTLPKNEMIKYQHSSVEDWIKGFYQCDFVITDSYHGTIFSILFNKPFIAIGNSNRGLTRFTSLLKLFNLENRFVSTTNQLDEKLLKSNIDFTSVNKILEDQRLKSFNFIKEALNE